MISLPLYSLLFVYLIFLAMFAVFMAINLYHIIMSASFTFVTFIVTFLTAVLTILTLYYTSTLLTEIDWQTQITIFNPAWFIAPQTF